MKPSGSRVRCHTWTPASGRACPPRPRSRRLAQAVTKVGQSWWRAPSSSGRVASTARRAAAAPSSRTTLASPSTAATAAASPAGPAPTQRRRTAPRGAARVEPAAGNASAHPPVPGPHPSRPSWSRPPPRPSDGPVVMPRPELRRDDVAGRRLHEACAPVRDAVDRGEAVEARADAAEHAARPVTDTRAPPRPAPGRDERRGDALSGLDVNGLAVELDREGGRACPSCGRRRASVASSNRSGRNGARSRSGAGRSGAARAAPRSRRQARCPLPRGRRHGRVPARAGPRR